MSQSAIAPARTSDELRNVDVKHITPGLQVGGDVVTRGYAPVYSAAVPSALNWAR